MTGDPWDILLGKEGAAVILTTFAFYVLEVRGDANANEGYL